MLDIRIGRAPAAGGTSGLAGAGGRLRRCFAGLPGVRAARQTRYACSGKLRIAYELRGAGSRRRPWLVLAQGVGLARAGGGPVLPQLQRHFRLRLIDNRGTGYSDRPDVFFSVTERAIDVLAVL